LPPCDTILPLTGIHPKEGKIALTAAQLAMLLEGIDWRLPHRSWTPLTAG
jgi:transposase